MTDPIRPLGGFLLCKRDEPPAVSLSGAILIPEDARQKSRRATVLAVGPGKLRDDGSREPMDDFHVGDRILVDGRDFHTFERDGETLFFVRADLIDAVEDASIDLTADDTLPPATLRAGEVAP